MKIYFSDLQQGVVSFFRGRWVHSKLSQASFRGGPHPLKGSHSFKV